MKERINIREIKKAIEHNKKLARKDEGGYETKEKEWKERGVYDSPLEEFGDQFAIVLPEILKEEKKRDEFGFLKNPKIFQIYIEQTLSKEKKQDLTAVEFGGPGSNLFRGFTKNFFRKTVGVCLKDIRSQSEQKDDEENNHTIVEGDILDLQDNKLLMEVTKKLGAIKIDLIISRLYGPLSSIYRHPAILDRIIRNWYSILNENGLMFIQFEPWRTIDPNKTVTEIKVEKWETAIKEKYPEIDIQVDYGLLRMHKVIGAPEKLLPATQLFK